MTQPTLVPGDRFGAYEVVELVGAGGMGEVYRARDTRLSRDVALKVLPDHRRLDPQRRARFEREAQLLSSLNHPNIATLHGIEESAGSTALVMELVEGETIADMLSSGGTRSPSRSGDRRGQPLQVRRALELARQIADALDSAHERGIIHRDLKPANIKVRPDGTVKVLDFGLAKAAADDVPGDTTAATLTASGTVGTVVGTAAYMSPEQARGLEVDRRTDVWAFGCVLYEMLTGRRAFDGDTASDALASLLTLEPDFTALPASVPPSVEVLLRRCLSKDARDRLRDIGDARIEIAEALAAPLTAGRRRVAFGHRWRIAAVLAVVAAVSATAAWIAARSVLEPSGTVTEVPLALPEAPILPQQPVPVQLSADGSKFLYHSVRGQAVADTSDQGITVLNWMQASDSRYSAPNPVGEILSPDGRSIAYFEAGALKTAPVTGGRAVTLASGVGDMPTAHWTRNGLLLVASDQGLFRVSEEPGGTLERIRVQALEASERVYDPVLLPDGRHILCTVATIAKGRTTFTAARVPDARIEVIDLHSGVRKTLVNGGGSARYLSSGHLVYQARGGIQARTFDLDRLKPGPQEAQVVGNVFQFSVSENGTLLYVTGTIGASRSDLVWASRMNAEEESLGIDPMRIVYPRLSPNGRRIAIVGDARGYRDIFVWDLAARRLTPITSDETDDQVVMWMDDDHVAFSSSRFGHPNMFMQAVDGAGEPWRLLESPNDQMPLAMDAGRLLFGERSRTRSFDDFLLDLRTHQVQPLLNADAVEANPTLSPGGQWLAYQSDESGQFEVLVQPHKGSTGRPKPISRGGATQPLFSREGSELFFRDFFGAVWSVPVPAFQPATKILDARNYSGQGASLQSRTYDYDSIGRRFLMITQTRQNLVLVVNWVERLKKLLPAP